MNISITSKNYLYLEKLIFNKNVKSKGSII